MPNPTIRPGSDEEWEALLRQLRAQPAAPQRPFFYARVQHRLATRPPSRLAQLLGWVRRPAYVALLSALVLAMSSDGTTLHPMAATSQYNGYSAGQSAPLPH